MTTICITGANRGIGLALAKHAHDKGHHVIGTARDPDAATDLKAIGDNTEVHQLDIADERSIATFAGALKDRPIDILINNAGIFRHECDSIQNLDAAALRQQIDVNTIAPLLVTRALLPNVASSGRKLIANISSNLGSITDSAQSNDHFLGYRVSKAALNMATATIAQELKEQGITAVAFHPGWVQTDMGGTMAPLEPTQSATDIWNSLDTLTISDTGAFIAHDNTRLPW